jgi:hypothetical protein
MSMGWHQSLLCEQAQNCLTVESGIMHKTAQLTLYLFQYHNSAGLNKNLLDKKIMSYTFL